MVTGNPAQFLQKWLLQNMWADSDIERQFATGLVRVG
jgi:hypothetical protein